MLRIQISKASEIPHLESFLKDHPQKENLVIFDALVSPAVAMACHRMGVRYEQGIDSRAIAPDYPLIDPKLTPAVVGSWLRDYGIDDELNIRNEIELCENQPLITVLTPFYETPIEWAITCINSMRNQLYLNWEWLILDDGSTSKELKRILREATKKDHRIKLKTHRSNKGPSAAYNTLIPLVSGSHVAFLDHDDELTQDALMKVAEAVAHDPSLDAIYSENDRITTDGRYDFPTDKPGWIPAAICDQMYPCHLRVYRKELLLSNRFDFEFDGTQDYEWLIRMLPQIENVSHIKEVLYHWRDNPNGASRTEKAMEATRKLDERKKIQKSYFLDIAEQAKEIQNRTA